MIAWAALVVWSVLTGSALVGPPAIWDVVDPQVNRGHYRPAPVEYRTWTSSPRRDRPGVCTFTVFALATRERLMRLQVNGREQLVDWSWSWELELPEGMRGDGIVIEFIDPVTRTVMARHELSETCWRVEP